MTCLGCGSERAPLAIAEMTPTGGVNEVCPDCGYVRNGPKEGLFKTFVSGGEVGR